ncbi:FAD-binding dehydrogenase [Thozetella sp. PMI_491]|nr:FAD-binding dehydrogenase [Thozetella sp. PMI_491]
MQQNASFTAIKRAARFSQSLSSLRRTYATAKTTVVGSGCAGLTTALVAAKQGLKVLVVEKSKYIGGTTAFSGGGLWIPGNKHQPAVGVMDDSAEKGDRYLQRVLGDAYEMAKIHAFLRSGPEMFKPVPLPDYHEKEDGASVGRTIVTKEFDARVLGRRVKDIRYTLQGYYAFRSMQADPAEMSVLTSPFGSLGNFTTAAAKVVRYLLDEIRFGKGAVLANGNALIGRLLYSCLQEKVDVWTNCPAIKATKDTDGTVTGIIIQQGDENTAIEARKGVVLASGGFGRSAEAKKYLPHDWTAQPAANVGDGKRMGLESGAVMPPPNKNNGIFAPISIFERSDGQVRRFPHFSLDRTKPGAIIVGPDGQRFANEAEPYQEFVKTMHALHIKKAFLIADRKFLRKYGMGMALPWPYPVNHLVRQGYLLKASNLAELAAKIGVPPRNLAETVMRCNEHALTGQDPEFGRGETKYDRFYGDSKNLPNPNLGTCSKPPFYALPLYPGNVSSVYGLLTDENAQAIGADGKPIRGLYAVGLDSNSIFKGNYPGGGSSIGPGMTFGYRAALRLAGVQDENQP